MNFSSQVQTVTEITQSIKLLLENGFSFIAVTGEISNLRKPFSGHMYFTLKDSKAQIKAVLFKTQQRYLQQSLTEGARVVCRGRISLYEPRGEYQIIVDSVSMSGEGELRIAFERLKSQLASEGLFDEGRKKDLPSFPKKIAIITSPQGAAIHDFLKISSQRFRVATIDIFPVAVQGDGAVSDIINALELIAQEGDYDTALICRGGGSFEDLWPFNSERLARVVSACSVPVVSAIGHEIDTTILDLVADKRAATPTAAAEIIFPEQNALRNRVLQLQEIITRSIHKKTKLLRNEVILQKRLLGNPTYIINNIQMRIDHHQASLITAMTNFIEAKKQALHDTKRNIASHNPQKHIDRHKSKLQELTKHLTSTMLFHLHQNKIKTSQAISILEAVNPIAVMERGFSIVTTNRGNIVRSKSEVECGDQVNVRLQDGSIMCEVK